MAPKRSKPHMVESRSLAIFLYRAPPEWIVRQVTERDYGVDLYVEIGDSNHSLTGDLVALQLKGASVVKFDKNDTHMAKSIKRSSLDYWLSFAVPVFLIVVCATTGDVYWANLRELNRQERFKGASKSVSIPVNRGEDFSDVGLARLVRTYAREKEWPLTESAIEKSLMLFNTFGPLVLMCQRAPSLSGCTTTMQYLLNQHYAHFETLSRYVLGKKQTPLTEWYAKNADYIDEKGLEKSHTLYYGVIKVILQSFCLEYIECIEAAHDLVRHDQSMYFSRTFPVLHAHLARKPHVFVWEDWFARYFFDEYENETASPEHLYFDDFDVFLGAEDGER